MVDAEKLLNQVLANIAKDHQFNNYETKFTLYESEGANYTSELYSITLSAAGKEDLHLFAKVALMGEQFRTLMTVKVFETEIQFYTEVIPKYRELEEQHKFPQEIRLVLPKYYGGSTEYMKETLVIEDLGAKGYMPFDRFKCFDWEYASQCVSALARLHALSVAFMRDQPEIFKDNTMGPGNQEQMQGFMETAVGNALKATAEEYRGKLAKFFEKNMTEEAFMDYYNPERKVVLVHGDFRPSNVLHRRDQNGKLEIVPVDFQIIQQSNPCVDLVYFFICGSDEEFRERYRRQYFDHYYQEFSTTLRRMAIDPDKVYTKQDFDADVETFQFQLFGMVLAVIALPIITVDAANAPKLDDGLDLNSLAIETSQLFHTRFNGLVKDYHKWGYLGSDPVQSVQSSMPPKKTERSCCCEIL